MKNVTIYFIIFSLTFFGAGCWNVSTSDCLDEPYLGNDPTITKFLETPQSPLSESDTQSPGGKLFASYEVFGESRDVSVRTEYIWAVITEYSPDPKPKISKIGEIEGIYTPDGRRTRHFSESLPIAIQISDDGELEKVLGYKVPGDGDVYAKDMVKIFPRCVRARMNSTDVKYMNSIVSTLQRNNEQAAEVYDFQQPAH